MLKCENLLLKIFFRKTIEILGSKCGYIKNEPCDILKNGIKNLKNVVLNYFLKIIKKEIIFSGGPNINK